MPQSGERSGRFDSSFFRTDDVRVCCQQQSFPERIYRTAKEILQGACWPCRNYIPASPTLLVLKQRSFFASRHVPNVIGVWLKARSAPLGSVESLSKINLALCQPDPSAARLVIHSPFPSRA